MKILKFIWSVIQDIKEASNSANLARNGHIERAKEPYIQ